MFTRGIRFLVFMGLVSGFTVARAQEGAPSIPVAPARPYKDYPIQAYPAQLRMDFLEDKLSKLPRSFQCSDLEIFSKLQSIISKETDERTVYVLHIAKWEPHGGSYSLKRTKWYVYRALRHRNADGSIDCTLVSTGFSAGGSPLIYADKNVWLVGIDYFDGSVDPGAVSLAYKLGNLPLTPEYVQNFSALVAGVLGATLPNVTGPGGGPGGQNAYIQEANKPKKVPGYVTVAKFDFIKRFPQSLTFSFSMIVNNIGALPPARIGVPYSASISAAGGTGVYQYSILPIYKDGKPVDGTGALPPGIGLDPETGGISGTPTAGEKKTYEFSLGASDTNQPPNETIVNASIDLSNSIFVQPIPTTANAIPTRFPDAKIGVPYGAILVPNVPTPAGSKYTVSVDTTNAKWLHFDSHTNLLSGKPQSGDGGPVQLPITVKKLPENTPVAVSAAMNVWPFPAGGPASAIKLDDAEPGKPYRSGLALGSMNNVTLTETGDLPKGLTFNPASGEISGTAMDPKDYGKPFIFDVQLASSSTGGANSTSVAGDFLFSITVGTPAVSPAANYDATVTIGAPTSATLTDEASVGAFYSATLKVNGIEGKYLILMPCPHRLSARETGDESAYCLAKEWFDLPPAFELKNEPGGQIVVLLLPNGEKEPAGDALNLEATPWTAGKADLAITICKEKDELRGNAHADQLKLLNSEYTENDCEKGAVGNLIALVNVHAPPLQPVTLSLGAGQASNPRGNQSQPPGGNQQSNNGPGGGGPKTPSQPSPANSAKNSGGSPSPAAISTVLNPQSVDCSVVTSQSPCTFSDTFQNMDREAFDFSIGVSIPGVRELKYSSVSAAPTKTTHADLYVFGDFYPLAVLQHFTDWSKIAYMPSKESWVPHFNFGIPATSQPFYRPYVGLSENLTSWTGAESHGFPLRINFFAGFVDMKQQILVAQPGGQISLKQDRALKPMFGIEVPVSSLVSKISGGKSQASKGGSGGGSNKN